MTDVEAFKKELKAANETGKLNIGGDTTKKLLRNSELAKVFIAKNAAKELKEDIHYYADIAKVEYEDLDIDSSELGILCKKNFNISVIAFKK